MTDSPAKPVGRRWHQIFEFSLALKGLGRLSN